MAVLLPQEQMSNEQLSFSEIASRTIDPSTTEEAIEQAGENADAGMLVFTILFSMLIL